MQLFLWLILTLLQKGIIFTAIYIILKAWQWRYFNFNLVLKLNKICITKLKEKYEWYHKQFELNNIGKFLTGFLASCWVIFVKLVLSNLALVGLYNFTIIDSKLLMALSPWRYIAVQTLFTRSQLSAVKTKVWKDSMVLISRRLFQMFSLSDLSDNRNKSGDFGVGYEHTIFVCVVRT